MAAKKGGPEVKEAKNPVYTVVVPFQDSRQWQTGPTPNKYEVGDDVSHFPPERLERVVELGLVQSSD